MENGILKYGEIYYIGQCNLDCFYCISSEMTNLQSTRCKMSGQAHFKEWVGFDSYIDTLKSHNINKIYISSTIGEPLTYKYFDELVDYLQNEHNFSVGLRTNAYFYDKHDICKLTNTISLSMNSLTEDNNYLIAGTNDMPDWINIFKLLDENNKKYRVTIVVNEFNADEITSMLDFINENAHNVKYVQLRKVYKYDDNLKTDFEVHRKAYDKEVKFLKDVYDSIDGFKESTGIHYKNINVFFWEDVFSEQSIQSLNYFTDGKTFAENLLVPGYETTK